MIKYLLFSIFVLHHINGQNQITFYAQESVCNCKVIHECEKLNELVVSHKFNELKTNYKSCGFDRKVPKYCCPFSHEEITAITNYELSEDPQPRSTSKAPKQIALSAFQRAILKNAGVKNIPDTIIKVQRPKINEPKVVHFLAEEPITNWKPQAVEGFFGPFEVFQPEMDILKNAGVTNIPDSIANVERSKLNKPRMVLFLAEESILQVFKENPGSGGPLPDLRAFPAIPEFARN